MSMQYLTADVTLISDSNATVASVNLTEEGSFGPHALTSVTGSAKRENGDKYDSGIARDLALGRALEKMGRRLQRRANGRVRAASEARRVRAEKRDRAAAEAASGNG